MLVQKIPGSAQVRTLATADGVLGRAMSAVRADGALSLQDAFTRVLLWLRGQVEAGTLQAPPALRALLLVVGGERPPARTLAVRALRGFDAGQALLDRLQDLQDEFPFLFRVDKDGLPRLRTLGELTGETPVRIGVDWSGSTAPPAAGLTFVAAAQADAAVRIAVLSADAVQSRHDATLAPHSDVALVLEAVATLQGEVSLQHPVVGAGIDTAASQSLALVYEFAPEETTLAALLHVPARLPGSVSLAALDAALSLPGQDSLRQVGMRGEASFAFNLSGELGASRLVLRSTTVSGRKRTIRRTTVSSAGLSVAFLDSGLRQRRIAKAASGAIVLQSRRASTTQAETALSLGAKLRITGWGTVARDLVSEALPDASALIERLQPLAQPQAWLQQRLRRKLPAALSALAPLLTGQAQGRAADNALRAMVQDLLLSRFDLWSAAATDGVSALADDLLSALPATDRHGARLGEAELRAWLAGVLDDLVRQARDRLTAFADHALHTRQARALREALEAVGIRVAGTGKRVQALADALLEFLRAYGALRAKLIDAARQALDVELSLAIDWVREDTDTDALEFDLQVPPQAIATPAAEADFRRWLLGQAFADPAHPFGTDPARVHGDWKATSTRYSEIGSTLTIDLDFTRVKSRTLLKADTRIEVGPGGVLLARTRTYAARTHTWGRDKVHAVGRALFDALASTKPLSQFSMELQITEHSLTRAELDGILGSLAGGPVVLLDTARAAALRLQWEALRSGPESEAGADRAGQPAARLTLAMSVHAAARRQVAAAATERNALRRAIAQAMAQAGSGRATHNLADAMQTLGYAGNPVDAFVQHWDELRRKLAGGPIGYVTLNGWRIGKSMRSSPLYPAAVQLKHCIAAAAAMEDMLRAVADWPDPDALAARTHAGLSAQPAFRRLSPARQGERVAAALADAYDARGSEFSADFARAFSSKDVLFDTSDDVPVLALFVLILLASLTDTPLKASLRAA